MGVRVVTDSSAVVPRAWADTLPLEIVALQLAWADGSVTDGDPPYADVADRLMLQPPPKTAAPSPGVYGALFERLLASNESLLVVTPATELSTTYQNATLAARNVGDERIRILDARTAAAGQGIVATEAARRAASEPTPSLDDVCDAALRAASRVEIWATLTQLHNLRRSGRVPAIAAIGAGALNLQPVVRYKAGNPTPVAVARSTSRAKERILRAWEKSIVPGGSLRLLAFHCVRDEDAAALVAAVRDRIAGAETHVVPATASLAAHTGPGLLGLAWLWD